MGLPLSCRQQSAGYWTSGMNDGVEMRVIIVVDVRRDAVQQSSVLRISKQDTLVAEDRGCGWAKEGAQGFVLCTSLRSATVFHCQGTASPKSLTYSDFDSFMITAAYCATGPVVKAPD